MYFCILVFFTLHNYRYFVLKLINLAIMNITNYIQQSIDQIQKSVGKERFKGSVVDIFINVI